MKKLSKAPVPYVLREERWMFDPKLNPPGPGHVEPTRWHVVSQGGHDVLRWGFEVDESITSSGAKTPEQRALIRADLDIDQLANAITRITYFDGPEKGEAAYEPAEITREAEKRTALKSLESHNLEELKVAITRRAFLLLGEEPRLRSQWTSGTSAPDRKTASDGSSAGPAPDPATTDSPTGGCPEAA